MPGQGRKFNENRIIVNEFGEVLSNKNGNILLSNDCAGGTTELPQKKRIDDLVITDDQTWSSEKILDSLVGNSNDTEVIFNDGEVLTGDSDFTYDKTNNVLGVGTIQFDLTPTHSHSEGAIHWDDDDKTLNIDTEVNGTAIQVGQEQVLRATNKTGVTLTNGQLVYVNGAQGNRPTVALADANIEAQADSTIGMITSDIDNNNAGYATTYGYVRDVDTNAYAAGTALYLSETAGAYTDTAPASPAHSIRIGYVLTQSATVGVILISIDTGADLKNLHDVAITSITDNDLLQYKSATSTWDNTAPLDSITTWTRTGTTLNPTSATDQVEWDEFRYQDATTGVTDTLVIGEGAGNIGTMSGNDIVAIGANAGAALESGSANVLIGAYAGSKTTSGTNCLAIGSSALRENLTGSNVAIGTNSCRETTGTSNVGIGSSSLRFNEGGANNIAIGAFSMQNGTTAQLNVAIGAACLENTNTSQVVAVGYNTARYQTGSGGTFVGYRAAVGADGSSTAPRCVALGNGALLNLTTGSNNTALGHQAGGLSHTSVGGCVYIGYQAGWSSNTWNKLFIENSSNVTNPLIGGDFNHNYVRIGGSLATQIATKTTTYTLTRSDSIILADASSGAFTLTLPTATAFDGEKKTIKKIDSSSNAVTIDAAGSQLIDGDLATDIIFQYDAIQIVAASDGWHIV